LREWGIDEGMMMQKDTEERVDSRRIKGLRTTHHSRLITDHLKLITYYHEHRNRVFTNSYTPGEIL
jgi:hypothetical protein